MTTDPTALFNDLDDALTAARAAGYTPTRCCTLSRTRFTCCAIGAKYIDLDISGYSTLTHYFENSGLDVADITDLITGFDQPDLNLDSPYYRVGQLLSLKHEAQ